MEGESTDENELEVARITIVRVLGENGLMDAVWAEDGNGDDLPLSEALGIMRLAEDTLIRERMAYGSD